MRGSKDRFFGICSPLFDRVERGLVFVVVSHLAMAETIHALRKLATNEFKPTFGVTGDHAEIQSECESVGKRLIEYVNALVDNKNAEIANYSDALNTIPASFQRSPTILDASREASSPNTGTPARDTQTWNTPILHRMPRCRSFTRQTRLLTRSTAILILWASRSKFSGRLNRPWPAPARPGVPANLQIRSGRPRAGCR